MPGIVGLITKQPREFAEPQLERMVEALKHESFYETGTLIDESLGLYLGWANRKSTFLAGMPWRNARNDVIMAFSGEDFPDPDVIHKPCACGAYLVGRIEEDRSFPAGLNGAFHGLVADLKQRNVSLFNDRYGMHRLYYHEAKDAFYFSAEAKAILAVRPELRSLDEQCMGEFVSTGCALDNRTLFREIYLLPQASLWRFSNGRLVHRGTYFHPSEWEDQERLAPESYYKEIRKVFTRNLPRYFNGGEQVAMSLTGGLDTRMIMAWQESSPGTLPCYTFGGMYRDCQDVVVARQVAGQCKQPYKVIETGSEFLARFPHYAERSVYLSDGSAGVNRSPDLYVQEIAREIAPIRIAGTYGSEILRGVGVFKPRVMNSEIFRPELASEIQRASKTYDQLARSHPVSFAAFQQAPQRGVVALEETQLAIRTPYLDNDLVRTVYRAPLSETSNRHGEGTQDICLRLIKDGDPELRAVRTDRGLDSPRSFSAAMTRALLEFTFKAEYAYDYGMPQWLARIDYVFSPFRLERLFLGRHKFYHFRVWYRDTLASYVREVLLDSRTLTRPYLDGKALETMVEAHLGGFRNYTNEIHTLLTLELVQRLFVDA
jgi:asparagine synthase (glutamine-hydrolysing)